MLDKEDRSEYTTERDSARRKDETLLFVTTKRTDLEDVVVREKL